MAIKIAGTTVVDDSRNLVNIGTLNSKTLFEKQVVLNQYGDLELFTGTDRWYAPTSLTITNITGRLYTPSVNDIVTFRVNKTQGNGSTTSTNLSFTANTIKTSQSVSINMTTDDYITVDITALGDEGDTGANLNVIFTYKET